MGEIKRRSVWEYTPRQVDIESDILEKVLKERASFAPESYTADDVRRALKAETIGFEEFKVLVSPAATPFLEEMAERAQETTRRYFGNAVTLFTPLYLANYCESRCVYCGFAAHNKIARMQLEDEQITRELEAISKSGLQDLLILTGEAPRKSDVEYIARATKTASRLFDTVGVEIYPMNVDEYRVLQENGTDYVTVFQETYDPERYGELHLGGEKRVFPYRFNAQERALLGGMRGVAFAALFGLDDFRRDAVAVGVHASLIQRKYPHAEISISVPRIRPAVGNENFQKEDVSERDLLQIICAYRLLLPFAAITISTRESVKFRDNAVKIAATKISAGVDVGIGGHDDEDSESKQFDINDNRSVDEIRAMLKANGLQDIFTDHIYLGGNND
ncbi:MAG: 2-iminoacetate synthase ThiH [Lactobacillales bacterium]|jgi:2-iminoacetate synthase|nr:2-iminoacetate synthase ThiH [Lactobacillales bacterium]